MERRPNLDKKIKETNRWTLGQPRAAGSTSNSQGKLFLFFGNRNIAKQSEIIAGNIPFDHDLVYETSSMAETPSPLKLESSFLIFGHYQLIAFSLQV